jgi:phosphatidylserine/phosphatidylglycerophosphate/cardiolipin synthase-like enzyme
LLSSCLGDAPDPTDPTPTQPWYDIYFTDPDNPSAASYRGGPDEVLAEAIRQARLSIDLAVYNFNLWSLRDALLEAHRRGLSVRMVTDSDNLDAPEVIDLEEAGIPVLGDRRESLMHNKFVVIDRQDVWGGSMNFTVGGAYKDNNNLIHIHSPELAKNYTNEFGEMFVDDRFGDTSLANTPFPHLDIEGTRVETYFSPDDGVANQILRLIQEARESIYFLAFDITSDDIAEAMIGQARDGLVVLGVVEESRIDGSGSEFERLHKAGIDVRKDSNQGNMHHKVIIIDEQILIVGSYNYTASAENENDENILVIHNPEIAGVYVAEFQRLFSRGQR